MTVKLDVNEAKGIITFAEHKCKDGYLQARQLQENENEFGKFVCIYEGDSDDSDYYKYLTVNSKDHAKALIKALNKSIELGWLE